MIETAESLPQTLNLSEIAPEQLAHYHQKSWLDWLELMANMNMVRDIDFQLAKFLSGQEKSASKSHIAVMICAVSYELSKGNTCLPIANNWNPLRAFGVSSLEPLFNPELLACHWVDELNQSSLVAHDFERAGFQEAMHKPLVFEFGSVYLQKYWHFEGSLAQKLLEYAEPINIDANQLLVLRVQLDQLFAWQLSYLFAEIQDLKQANASSAKIQRAICESLDVVDLDGLAFDKIVAIAMQANSSHDLEQLAEYIPLSACVNYQKLAAATALTRRFCVISGGPGTGKTTTVSKLLAALVASSEKDLDIKLAAPTGKAAARLTESIGQAIDSLPVSPQIKQKIPTSASTLHRLLGAIPNRTEFKHNAQNLLHLDLLILDEASMVDLPMMCKLLNALPAHARLILLGDRDQLSSVEAGAVLGDICQLGTQGYSPSHKALLSKLTGYELATSPQVGSAISDSLCVLQKSFRFHSRSGIGKLARAINAGEMAKVDEAFAADYTDIEHFDVNAQTYAELVTHLVARYKSYLNLRFENNGTMSMSSFARQVLQSFSQTRLLCAVREGEFGVEGANNNIEKALAGKGLIPRDRDTWYIGRPVMVKNNDHNQQLYNGDIGICLLDESLQEPRLKVYFELPDGSVKGVLPSRVPPHETAYSMTIHKSQGSEFNHTLLLLPKTPTPVLTRELFYTGVTRAKNKLSIYADTAIIQRAIKQKTARSSHLSRRLATN
ncbi:exodeoxyribonuclease V subunit alpha [Vibrio sp. UCD-FRSSP16_10]|uniref:exodeoxyribonuclease V subunit alpha n=1 Tax=unclassified Vibrio TaxID=2614977 RepID=UPI00080142A8|nr:MULTISPECIES: exodeoxyribonuclease V subunit alpha [unclassified Vibrio]OBT06569.1 exodeoxyribonuclease V subunit alpha [Vibrio sp. UCD-FRSSP16_30]OBT12266.1 exodeoxyribonuclease V subunit alpha [Vibrio sp. UCD-FRSSP16_10]